MNQVELRQMADERILDAAALINEGRWAFAYYVAGYAVECALKSCVLARMIHTAVVFDEEFKNKTIREIFFRHNFVELVRLAGLMGELNSHIQSSGVAGSAFVGYWATVKDWKETSRYEANIETEARSLFEAVENQPDGVLQWIWNYW